MRIFVRDLLHYLTHLILDTNVCNLLSRCTFVSKVQALSVNIVCVASALTFIAVSC